MGGQQFNQTVKTLLDFALRKKLMDMDNSAATERLDQQRKGYLDLEGARTANDLTLKEVDRLNKREEQDGLLRNKLAELKQQFLYDLAKMPEFERMSAMGFDMASRGEDTTQLESQYQKLATRLVTARLKAIKGAENVDEDDVMAVMSLGPEMGQKIWESHQKAWTAKASNKLDWAKQGTDQFQAETARMNAKGGGAEGIKSDLAMIDKIYSTVVNTGALAVTPSKNREAIKNRYTRENYDAAKSKIIEIRERARVGEMTPEDKRFLQNVVNVGLVNETGVQQLYTPNPESYTNFKKIGDVKPEPELTTKDQMIQDIMPKKGGAATPARPGSTPPAPAPAAGQAPPIVAELQKRGFTLADLNGNQALIDSLSKSGFDVESIKKYF